MRAPDGSRRRGSVLAFIHDTPDRRHRFPVTVCAGGGAVGDAIANLKYTLNHLKSDASDWESFIAYGSESAAGAA